MPNIPHIYGTSMHTYSSILYLYLYPFSLVLYLSRIITLAIHYEDYSTYACKYVSILFCQKHNYILILRSSVYKSTIQLLLGCVAASIK